MPDQRETLVRKMVAEGLDDDAIVSTLKVYDTQQSAAPNAPAADGAMSKASDFLPTAGGIIGGIAGGIPGAALGGAAGQGYQSLVDNITEIPGALADIARNVVGGHAGATAKGFAEGSGLGAADAAMEGALSGATQGAVKLATKAPGLVVGGLRMAGVPIPAGVARVVGMLPRTGAKAATAAAPAVESGTVRAASAAQGPRLARIAAKTEPVAAPAAPVASGPRIGQTVSERMANPRGHTEALTQSRTATAELPQSWRQFVKPAGVQQSTAPAAVAKRSLTIDDFGGLDATEKAAIRAEQSARGMTTKISADDAARYLREHGSMIPPGTKATRAARHLSDAQMENRYRHLIENGAANPRLLATMGAGVSAPPAMKALLDYLGGDQ